MQDADEEDGEETCAADTEEGGYTRERVKMSSMVKNISMVSSMVKNVSMMKETSSNEIGNKYVGQIVDAGVMFRLGFLEM